MSDVRDIGKHAKRRVAISLIVSVLIMGGIVIGLGSVIAASIGAPVILALLAFSLPVLIFPMVVLWFYRHLPPLKF